MSDKAESSDAPADWALTDEHEEKISFSAVAPVNVQVRHLNVQVVPPIYRGLFKRQAAVDEEKASPKLILTDINADFPPGSITGIIGSSGSGKTTFLNVLSHRMRSSNLKITGQPLYNESPSLSTVTHAYVTQTDVLLPTLTVRETLMYAAELRLPASVNREQRKRLVEEVIMELGLKECANTTVGDGFRRRGCSGGERRRVSVGIQLLGSPSLIYLDEPTTGLDSTSAYNLVKTLKSIAGKGRTIILSIHQPSPGIFFMLDRVALLAQGQMVYTGRVDEVMPWFETLLPPLPPHVNPADYLINAAAIDVRTVEAELESLARVQNLTNAWKGEAARRFADTKSPNIAPTDDYEVDVPRSGNAPIQRTARALVSRTFKTSFRDPLGLITSWIEAALMGISVGLVFLQLPESSSGIRSREAALYTAVGLQGYLMAMFEVYRLCVIEMPVFDREHGEGVVGVVPWLLSYRFSHFFLEDIIVPFVYSATTYWMMNLAHSAIRFFLYFAVVFLCHIASVTFAGVAVAVSRDLATASLVANLSYTLHTFACGFFIQADSIPIWLRWTKWISHLFYGFTALVFNEFHDRFYDCPSGDARTDAQCISYRGDFIIRSLAVPRPDNWRTIPLVAMLGFSVGYFLISMFILFAKKVDITMLGQKKNVETKEKRLELPSQKISKVQLIDVGLRNYSLRIHNRGSKTITVLDGINTDFEANKVNVILGPSGSGKSSLLNLMAQRLQSTWRTTYEADGQLLLNGVAADGNLVQSLCSYVTQDDDALLPYLTVRETLRFAAGLRLPQSWSKEDKIRKADEVLDKMGLRDCADTLVGGELKKGISGGEKRRVSIAIQVLTEPQILILDEFSSGLDAFNAASVMSVLTQLASEGRTIITSIHQGSWQLFKDFGNILLLAKGGRVAYSGPGTDMLGYFASIGFKCPATTNPADFALDVVAIDLREESMEKKTREKVHILTDAFKSKKQVERSFEGKLPPSELKKYEKRMPSIFTSLPLLIRRGWLGFKRQPEVPNARFFNPLGLGIVSAIYFSPLGFDYVDVQNRIGCLNEILPLYFVGLLVNVAVYPTERDIFYREYEDGAYSTEAFISAYTLLEIPSEILAAAMFASLAAIATNLKRSIAFFFITSLNALSHSRESLGIIFNTFFSQQGGLALNVANVLLSVSTFMAGLMSIDQPGFFKGLNRISPLGYAVKNLTPYSFRGQTFACTDAQRLPDGRCIISTGEDVLAIYNLEEIDAALNLGAIVVTVVVYRLIAYAILKLAKTRFRIRRKL
ncbi:P-loop containing nucleoside triphosphate hydrolase protein [Cylindrobasidium torrendii FP15055 ss-10]|uniref:p-loop containing nucleoside triphosphate hydrolase protein n=1 Tax=Cylindrobasidium torrendii FP15055 ss-10 TaxID=1314674 RepID=A0A0D7BU79_9AGAR|nr:P-loop containing nucleoside triphosphate hydrolase protein [Cylindrobasidium torrendii FP15055 ss-10]